MRNKEEKQKLLNIIFLALGTLFLIGVWYILAICLRQSGNRILEYPHQSIWRSLCLLFGQEAGITWKAIWHTLHRLIIGFIISFVLAALLGTLAGIHGWFRKFLKPSIGLFKTIPTAAVVIVLVGILMGISNRKAMNIIPVVLTIVVGFPILFEAFASGIENEKQSIKDAAKLEGNLNNPRIIVSVLWPDCWPYIKMGIAQTLGLSMKVSVMSEILSASSASNPGIGTLISVARQEGAIENIISYSLIVLGIMILIDLPLIIIKSKSNKK